MTATDELRRMLDERGVEHYDGTKSTLWLKDEHGYRASADELTSGRLSVHIWCDTPAQAIAATLGAGTCHEVEDEDTGFIVCSECGAVHDKDYTSYYCWCCGRRIEVDE